MEDQIERIYNDLTDELFYLFSNIASKNGGKYSIKYSASADHLYNSGGCIILGCDKSLDLEYAYDLKFIDESDNKKKRSYLYSKDYGFKNISTIASKKDQILDILKISDCVSAKDIEYVNNLFEDISERQDTLRSKYDLDELKEVIERSNINILQNIIASTRKESREYWKLIYSKDQDGSLLENDVNVVFSNNNSLLCRTDRIYYNSSNNKKKYPFGLLISKNKFTGNFCAKRVKRNKFLEDEDYEWSIDDINVCLGFEETIWNVDKNKIDTKSSTRISDNYIVSPLNYDEQFREHVKNTFGKFKKIIRRKYIRDYIKQEDININNTPPNKLELRGRDLYLSEDLTTSEIKELQDKLQIDESRVRNIQDRRDIGRLSSNLRRDIVKDIFHEKTFKWTCDQVDTKIDGNLGSKSIDIGDQKFNISILSNKFDSITTDDLRSMLNSLDFYDITSIYNLSKKITRDKFNQETDKKVTKIDGSVKMIFNNCRKIQNNPRYKGSYLSKILIPNKSELSFDYPYGYDTVTIEEGVYGIKELNSINRYLYY